MKIGTLLVEQSLITYNYFFAGLHRQVDAAIGAGNFSDTIHVELTQLANI